MSSSAPRPFDLRAALDASGWRYTRQRQAVYDFLCGAAPHHHPTAEEIFSGVRQLIPHISLATVYKALEALEASGVVTRLTGESGRDSARFDARAERHYHLRCLRSGQVEDLPTPYDADLLTKLDPHLADTLEQKGFHLTGYRLELVGYFEGENGPSDTPRERS
jgi:Fe2+ or Zn2+ uptake regulation protein